MPIYEFVCERCGRLVERLQKVTDPPPEACPECGRVYWRGTHVQRMLSRLREMGV